MITHKVVTFVFDTLAFSHDVTRAVDIFGGQELADILGVGVSTVDNWAKARMHKNFPYPSMTNLIVFCNLLDHDPRKYFVLGE